MTNKYNYTFKHLPPHKPARRGAKPNEAFPYSQSDFDSKSTYSFAKHIWFTYKLDYQHYLTLLDQQQYRCGLCGRTSPSSSPWYKFFCVDHCHTTNRIRGLLCRNCNAGLGLLGDSVESITKVLEYLKKQTT